MRLMLKNVRLAFPAIFEPAAIGDGEPAYGAKLILDPDADYIAEIKKAVMSVAKEKWKDKAADILAVLKDDKRICYVEAPYKNKDGQIYDGFEGKYSLSTRNPTVKPKALDKRGNEVGKSDGVIYPGCYVHASVEFWAQDNQWGRRINCNLRGVMFAKDGDSFGGSTAASADEFKEFAVDDADDIF